MNAGPSPDASSSAAVEGDCEAEAERLVSLSRGDDPSAFDAFVEELGARWGARDPECYFSLVLRACELLDAGSTGWGPDAGRAEAVAMVALHRPDTPPPDLELGLLRFLRAGDMSRVEGPDRRERAQLWLRGWQRLEDAIDPGFDETDTPDLNVAPPGLVTKAGADPEAISDPVIRGQYEAELARNAAKAKTFRRQLTLRRLRDSYQEDLTDVLGALYEHDPRASDELHALLDTYVEDRATRDRILHRVAEAGQD